MLLFHYHWLARCIQLVILISVLIPSLVISANALTEDVLENRDGEKPLFRVDRRRKSFNIVQAHEVLRQGLQQFLDLVEDNSDLGYYINYLLYLQRNTIFLDEYGEEIRSYKKVFRFIWEQFNETQVQNYAVRQFDKDKLDLCSVARYLSHQPAVENRETIMKRMGDALDYRCHPCTPYKRKEHSAPPIINTGDIKLDGISPEERHIMCKGFEFSDQTGNNLPPTTSTTMATAVIETFADTEAATEVTGPNQSTDYGLCTHSNQEIVCDSVPIDEVEKIFKRTSSVTVDKLMIKLVANLKPFIPENFLNNKRTKYLMIWYPDYSYNNKSDHVSLRIDPDAFQFTKYFTTRVSLHVNDCSELDLGFLAGFNQLNDLHLSDMDDIQACLPTLPPLPNLARLHFKFVGTGQKEVTTFPTIANGIKEFLFGEYIEQDKELGIHAWDDDNFSRVMDWLLISSSETLKYMLIDGYLGNLTQIPTEISSFKALERLHVQNNAQMSTIKAGQLSFSVPVLEIFLNANKIEVIETGSFQGNFKDAKIKLEGNKLARLDEAIFQPIIQQMIVGKGNINVNNNPIDCSENGICHLAWLMPYQVVGKQIHGSCFNGTSLVDLNSSGFNHCPSFSK